MTFRIHLHATGTWSWSGDEPLAAEVEARTKVRVQQKVAAIVARDGWSEHTFEMEVV